MTEDARVTAVLRLFQPDTLVGGPQVSWIPPVARDWSRWLKSPVAVALAEQKRAIKQHTHARSSLPAATEESYSSERRRPADKADFISGTVWAMSFCRRRDDLLSICARDGECSIHINSTTSSRRGRQAGGPAAVVQRPSAPHRTRIQLNPSCDDSNVNSTICNPEAILPYLGFDTPTNYPYDIMSVRLASQTYKLTMDDAGS